VVTVGAVIFVGLAAGEVVVAGGGVTSEPTVHVSTYQAPARAEDIVD